MSAPGAPDVRARVIVAGLRRGASFLNAAAHSNAVRVVGAADTDATTRNAAAGQHGLSGDALHADVPAALKATPADILLVATPTRLHAEHVIAGLRAGLHVLCEKPLTTDRESALRIRAESQRAGRRVAVVQNMRAWPQFRKAREMILGGVIGRLSHVHILFRRWRPGQRLGHRHVELLNHGVHHMDLLRSLTGLAGAELLHATEWDPPWWQDAACGHCVSLAGRAPEGWTFAYDGSYAETGCLTGQSGHVHIVGERGALDAGGSADHEPSLRLTTNARARGSDLAEDIAIPPRDPRDIDREILDGFARACASGGPFETDLDDNLLTLGILFDAMDRLDAGR